jgi:hypothetical protein
MPTAHQFVAGGSSTSMRSVTLCSSMSLAAAAAQIMSKSLVGLVWVPYWTPAPWQSSAAIMWRPRSVLNGGARVTEKHVPEEPDVRT